MDQVSIREFTREFTKFKEKNVEVTERGTVIGVYKTINPNTNGNANTAGTRNRGLPGFEAL